MRPGIGYWIRNPYATHATIDVYGLMDEAVIYCFGWNNERYNGGIY